MEKFNEMMVQIKKRPGMYIGKKSLKRLGWYLEGYELCRNSVGEDEFKFSEEFQDFVVRKYKLEKYTEPVRLSYIEIIMLFTQCECTSVDEFFKLYDEFMEIRLGDNDAL